MPKVLVYKFLYFFFYAGDINERGHVHVANTKSMNLEPGKIWFENEVEIFSKGSLKEKELLVALHIVENNKQYLVDSWEKFKKGNKVKLKTVH